MRKLSAENCIIDTVKYCSCSAADTFKKMQIMQKMQKICSIEHCSGTPTRSKMENKKRQLGAPISATYNKKPLKCDAKTCFRAEYCS